MRLRGPRRPPPTTITAPIGSAQETHYDFLKNGVRRVFRLLCGSRLASLAFTRRSSERRIRSVGMRPRSTECGASSGTPIRGDSRPLAEHRRFGLGRPDLRSATKRRGRVRSATAALILTAVSIRRACPFKLHACPGSLHKSTNYKSRSGRRLDKEVLNQNCRQNRHLRHDEKVHPAAGTKLAFPSLLDSFVLSTRLESLSRRRVIGLHLPNGPSNQSDLQLRLVSKCRGPGYPRRLLRARTDWIIAGFGSAH